MCSFGGGGPALEEKACVHLCCPCLKWSLRFVKARCLNLAFVFLGVDLVCVPVLGRQRHLPVDHLCLGVSLSCTGKCNCRAATQEQNNRWEGAQGTKEMKKGDRSSGMIHWRMNIL